MSGTHWPDKLLQLHCVSLVVLLAAFLASVGSRCVCLALPKKRLLKLFSLPSDRHYVLLADVSDNIQLAVKLGN